MVKFTVREQPIVGRPQAASHVQSHKRPSERPPGILHRASRGAAVERQSVEHYEKAADDTRWRVISALAFLMFSALLVLIFTGDAFYVQSIQAHGLIYQTGEEIFAFSDIADYHIFWLDPELIRANILRSASVADASVELGWPPDMVTVQVEERQPALLWSEAGKEVWIDLQGRAMPVRADIPGLPRVTVDGGFEGPLTAGRELGQDTVLGALRMQEILPDGTDLDYNPIYGLGWTNHRGWRIWVGSGTGMSEKIGIYEFLFDNLAARGIEVEELNIANPDAPFYRVLWGR